MKRKVTIFGALVAAATIAAGAFLGRTDAAGVDVGTDLVTRGSIVTNVSATGTLEAVTTVQVGSQVSGVIEALYADFNSIVRKGQVLARLDQSLFQAAIDQAQANLIRAEADYERVRVALTDADAKLARARELAARQLIPKNELDTAEVNRAVAETQVRSSAAAVTQARASLQQAQVNLDKTIIRSPIDGVVISRDVDVGQTVAASMSAPTLFQIAADLTQMQLNASIDESDLGVIKEGQAVTFRVDAYPDDVFRGVVKQVRLSPVVIANVVSYAAIITAPNPALKLMPGMTATLDVEVARRDDVLRVPAAALRFRPTAEQLEAMNALPAEASDRGARVWQPTESGVVAVPVRTGISDGVWTEVLDGQLKEGTPVVTRVSMNTTSQRTSGGSGNPLLSQPGRGR
ncbi:MAG TPA: efflux RND transporter periplasmic adaptor subunit [Vicinamibacterales bacterium]